MKGSDAVERSKREVRPAETAAGKSWAGVDSDGPGDDAAVAFTRAGFFDGVRKSAPLLVGVVPFGLVFGVMARQSGLAAGEAVLMSATVFAGASQLVALTLWGPALPVFSIATATLLINLRLVLMSAALFPYFSRLSRGRIYGSLFFLTDGGWALQLEEFEKGGRNAAFLIGSGVAQYAVWVSSSALGFRLGNVISRPEIFGLDFIVTASFLALVVGMWRGKSSLVPWLVAIAASIAAYRIGGGNWHILAGGLAGSVAGAIFQREEPQ